MVDISKRKTEHIEICLKENVESGVVENWFQDITLIHDSLPEIDRDEVDLSTNFLGHGFSAPLIVAGMTGGTEKGKKINAEIAKAVEKLDIGMGVGSQRQALIDPSLSDTYSITRRNAPTAYIIANIGASQLAEGISTQNIQRLIDMVDADALAIHLNPLQEAVQYEGEPNYRGLLSKISELTNKSPVPIIAKETGAGISKEAALKIEATGVKAIDIGGAGGTSFSKVEHYRAKDAGRCSEARLAQTFSAWGIPTAISLLEIETVAKLPVIATGGIREGITAVKALRLGATLVGLARPILEAVSQNGYRGVEQKLNQIMDEMKTTMYLIGAPNIKTIKEKPVVFSRRIQSWIEQRGLKVP